MYIKEKIITTINNYENIIVIKCKKIKYLIDKIISIKITNTTKSKISLI